MSYYLKSEEFTMRIHVILTLLLLEFAGCTCGDCPNNWVQHADFCYFFSNDMLNWTSARDSCFSKGGYLAEPQTKTESSFLEGFTRPQQKPYWLGGSDQTVEGQWIWDHSKEPFTYTDWHHGEPNDSRNNEDCLNFWPYFNQLWNDYVCAMPQFYICEQELPSTGPILPVIVG